VKTRGEKVREGHFRWTYEHLNQVRLDPQVEVKGTRSWRGQTNAQKKRKVLEERMAGGSTLRSDIKKEGGRDQADIVSVQRPSNWPQDFTIIQGEHAVRGFRKVM